MSAGYVAVVGAGDATGALAAAADAAGRGLARSGVVVVCGGLGGVMEAACRGAQAEGGTTVGILPGRDRTAANPFVSVAVATGLGEARNAVVVATVDVVLAVGGEWGTLSEIALARKAGTPVVGLVTWDLTTPAGDASGIAVARDADDAVALVLEALTRRP